MCGSDTDYASPIVSYKGRVLPEWIDWNGHMNVAYYVVAFDLATDQLFDMLGIGKTYRKASNCSSFTLELHVNYLKEIKEDEEFQINSYILGVDAKRLHVFHEMTHAISGEQVATNENMFVHIDMEMRRSSPFPGDLLEKLQCIADSHGSLRRPTNAGRSIGF